MTRRILRVAIAAVVLAALVLGVPAAVLTARIVSDHARSDLQRTALRAAVEVSPTYRSGDPVELGPSEPGVTLGVYSPAGTRVSGDGPSALAADEVRTAEGQPVSATRDGQIVELVPVSSNEQVIALVRAATPESVVRMRTAWWLAGLIGGVIIACGCASAYAAREARRLGGPLIELQSAAESLGQGDFAVTTRRSGIVEVDSVGGALELAAGQLAEALNRERRFADHASHQLRTPLTQLRLRLEQGLTGPPQGLAEAALDALDVADQLSSTVDDVLQLARAPFDATPTDVARHLESVVDQWRGPVQAAGRQLRLRIDPAPPAAASPAVIRQAVQALLDNALRHGSGTITVTLRESFDALAVDVTDEGTGPPIEPDSESLGLGIVRSALLAAGGRLVVDRSADTRFTILLPATPPPRSDEHRDGDRPVPVGPVEREELAAGGEQGREPGQIQVEPPADPDVG